MSGMPGPEVPADIQQHQQTLESTGIAVDSTGTTRLQALVADEAEVALVRVDPTAADFDFNVNLNSTAVFGADQSPAAAAEEEFFPTGTNYYVAGVDQATVEFEVTSASATTGATADVTVLTLSDKDI